MNTQDPATGYAYWMPTNGRTRVYYSLSIFAEIDAVINDGYRRIPHGGVETGGLLFGTERGDTLQVEAYRLIACQHALGPSFVLSEVDLAGLRKQLAEASADAELAGLTALGWFIGHTRSPLTLSDREALWFDEFFPKPRSLTVLVKPERFQATRFAFLLRDPEGRMERTSPTGPMILPLSTHGASTGSLPAPSVPADVPAGKPRSMEPAPVAEPASEIVALNVPEARSATPISGEKSGLQATSEPVFAAVIPPKPAAPPIFAEPSDAKGQSKLDYPYASLARGRTRTESAGLGGFGLRSVAVLLLAAILGCVAGYWAYLQLPSPVIPVSVHEQRNQLVVEWPAAQTANVDYAALQVNEGPLITLSAQQKVDGRASIDVPRGDLKIDLVAKHWLRDSRGIVRYLRTPRSGR